GGHCWRQAAGLPAGLPHAAQPGCSRVSVQPDPEGSRGGGGGSGCVVQAAVHGVPPALRCSRLVNRAWSAIPDPCHLPGLPAGGRRQAQQGQL
ncbi:hypothetical protein HaLaN_28936, partial [Haematococcus lacustris]